MVNLKSFFWYVLQLQKTQSMEYALHLQQLQELR